MPKITDMLFYGGARERIKRLGLLLLFEELLCVLAGFELKILEKRDANGGAALRKLIDHRIEAVAGWHKKVSGGIDWTKTRCVEDITVCLGVEIEVSGRSDLVAVDLLHFQRALRAGEIDVGVLVVPSASLSHYLVSRAPSLPETQRIFEAFNAHQMPIVILALEHDGFGDGLPVRSKVSRQRQS